MTLFFVVLAPFLGLLLPLLLRSSGRSACALGAAIPASIALGLVAYHWETVLTGNILRASWEWIPALGFNFSLRLDGLSILFALLILGIGLLIILYARYYLDPNDKIGKFYCLILAFMGSMLGIVMSDNLLLMLMFWEMTSLCSFLLIGFWNHKAGSRHGAQMALIMTGGGGFALMAGVLLLGQIVGTFDLTIILQSGDLIRNHALYPVMLILLLLGAFIKSAQFPFHFWLPQAMTAPTPVSAYLHSATMVKVGVFLLARLHPAIAGTDLWFYLVTFTGLITLLYGAVNALLKYDLKSLLAYSTISHLGLITLLFGMDTEVSTVAAIFHIINHAIFKASLFMAAGIIDHETGTRDLRRINGLWRYMPETTTLAIIAALSMAGVPLLNGFLSKEMFFAESLKTELLGSFNWLIPLMATLAGIFAVGYSIRFVLEVFFNGHPKSLPIYPPKEPPLYMKIPVAVLVALCLFVGIFPDTSVGYILAAATKSVLNGDLPEYKLSVLHGFNLPLLMSIISMVGGYLIYIFRKPLLTADDHGTAKNPGVIFQRVLINIINRARDLMMRLDNGTLQRYIVLLLLSVLTVGTVGLLPLASWSGPVPLSDIDPVIGAGFVLLCISTIVCVLLHHQRFIALIMLGMTGLMVSLAFAGFSAPDLAMTQLTVEVVTTVLFMLALYYLPQYTPQETPRYLRVRDLILAGTVGAGVTGLTYAILTRPYQNIAGFFLERSKTEGGGTNVINVILTDFRAMDTLGEITVLSIAALGAVALLQQLKLRKLEYNKHYRMIADVFPLVVRVSARPLLPMSLMVAAFMLLRGHNAPGGGFVAGLMVAVALILQYIANGSAWMRERMPFNYALIIATGLLIALLTGVGPWFFGLPFLTTWFGHFDVPVLGEVELASAMVFDVGVFLAVAGSALLVLSGLGRIIVPPPEPAQEPSAAPSEDPSS